MAASQFVLISSERTATCLGIGINLVGKYKKVGESGSFFALPSKERKRERPKTGIDDFDKCAIKFLIYEQNREAIDFPRYLCV